MSLLASQAHQHHGCFGLISWLACHHIHAHKTEYWAERHTAPLRSHALPLTPSSSNLSFTLTSTHAHHQHISPHRHLPNCIEAGSGNPTAQKNYINTSLTDSYRPVSLFTFIAKPLERVVFNQLSSFLSKHNLLDANQSGFRRGHSTETALLSVTEALRIAKADSKSSVLILLDLSAAFDTVNHQILLTNLSSQGITGFHFAGLNPIWMVGLSRWPGEGRYPQNINWSLGFLRDRFLDPSSSPHTLHHWVPSYRHMVSHTIAMLMTHSSISRFDQMIRRYLHGSQAAWRTSRHGWKNIIYSSTCQRLSFLSSLPLQLYNMISPSS